MWSAGDGAREELEALQIIPYRAGVETKGLDSEEHRPEIKIPRLPASLAGVVCKFPGNPAGVGG